MSTTKNVISNIASDAKTYFIEKNKGVNNAVVVATATATPDIINLVTNLTAGVNLQHAVATGGTSMYIAGAVILLRFVLYLYEKASTLKKA